MGGGEDDFEPSALGTKEHWDAAYKRELQHFDDTGDAGEIWFGEESMSRLIGWLEKQKIPLDSCILDIGTGNGVLLAELAKSGYTDLVGIDYSPSAIWLSKKIMEKEGLPQVKLQVEDILNPSDELSGFHVCIDKGTFDAISLNPENAAEKRKQYVKSLHRILRPGGLFLITSCNWTREELLNEFGEVPDIQFLSRDPAMGHGYAGIPRTMSVCRTLSKLFLQWQRDNFPIFNWFLLLEELPTSVFCFGGKTGNNVTVLVLQKRI